jgi:predicted alpha/beta superfamily hydrolase
VLPYIQPGVEVRQLHSQILNQGMQLTIKLPWSYARSDTTYPVLFCLDANRSFPLYSTMSLIYETPGFDVQEIIIVGIGYQVDDDRIRGLAQWAAWRTRDLLPERSEKFDAYWKDRLSSLLGGEEIQVKSGGAHHFLHAIKEEIIPFIEANYRAASKARGLAGCSYGGLFTLYVLFHEPQLFERYFAGSPTLWDKLFEYEENYASTHSDIKARLLLTAGSKETDLVEDLQRMVACLRSRMYPGLEVLTHVFEDEGHVSAGAAAISRALKILYYEGERKD